MQRPEQHADQHKIRPQRQRPARPRQLFQQQRQGQTAQNAAPAAARLWALMAASPGGSCGGCCWAWRRLAGACTGAGCGSASSTSTARERSRPASGTPSTRRYGLDCERDTRRDACHRNPCRIHPVDAGCQQAVVEPDIGMGRHVAQFHLAAPAARRQAALAGALDEHRGQLLGAAHQRDLARSRVHLAQLPDQTAGIDHRQAAAQFRPAPWSSVIALGEPVMPPIQQGGMHHLLAGPRSATCSSARNSAFSRASRVRGVDARPHSCARSARKASRSFCNRRWRVKKPPSSAATSAGARMISRTGCSKAAKAAAQAVERVITGIGDHAGHAHQQPDQQAGGRRPAGGRT